VAAVRFVVVGAGAVGGTVGARLAEHGHEAVLVARGAHLEAIRRAGLTLHMPGRSVTVHPPTLASVAEVDWADGDVAVLAVKSHHTEGVLADLVDAAPSSTPVVCLQNGVSNEPLVARRFAHVHGVCVMQPCSHLEPGVVVAHSAPLTGLLDIGSWPHGTDAVDESVAAVLSASGFESVARPDIMRWKHQKLLMNLPNAVEAACGVQARFGELSRLARAEGAAVLEAAHIPFTSAAEDRARRASKLTMEPAGGLGWQGGSTWQSLARGTGEVEARWLNGEIVRIGEAVGVRASVNALLVEVAEEMAAAGEVPGSRDEADLLARLAG
jgi:2-dehydropantoate 2-reductase